MRYSTFSKSKAITIVGIPFVPSDLPLKVWFKPEDGKTLNTTDGTNTVEHWVDKVTGFNIQNHTKAIQPRDNGDSIETLNNSSYLERYPGIDIGDQFSIYVVVKMPTGAGIGLQSILAGQPWGGLCLLSYGLYNDTRITLHYSDVGFHLFADMTGTFHLLELHRTEGECTAFVDGISKTITKGYIADNHFNNRFGGIFTRWTTGIGAVGSIKDIIITDGVLSDSNKSKMRGYLNNLRTIY